MNLGHHTPALLQIRIPGISRLIGDVRTELEAKAAADANGCMGYFPGLKKQASMKGVDFDFPMCIRFAEEFPKLAAGDKELSFNFLRLSNRKQSGDFPFHIDTDAKSAMGGTRDSLKSVEVWRLLLNLSSERVRYLEYIDHVVEYDQLAFTRGYVHSVDSTLDKFKKRVTIPATEGELVSGVLFCASKVLHTGRDEDGGHFVAGYGIEVSATNVR